MFVGCALVRETRQPACFFCTYTVFLQQKKLIFWSLTLLELKNNGYHHRQFHESHWRHGNPGHCWQRSLKYGDNDAVALGSQNPLQSPKKSQDGSIPLLEKVPQNAIVLLSSVAGAEQTIHRDTPFFLSNTKNPHYNWSLCVVCSFQNNLPNPQYACDWAHPAAKGTRPTDAGHLRLQAPPPRTHVVAPTRRLPPRTHAPLVWEKNNVSVTAQNGVQQTRRGRNLRSRADPRWAER